MKQAIYRFLADESGLTTVEYAIAGALVSVAVVGAFLALGGQISTTIGLLRDAMIP